MRTTVMVGMITVGTIRNDANYLSHHLRKNDYWAEGEKAMLGEWIGEGAKALGLSGQVNYCRKISIAKAYTIYGMRAELPATKFLV
jgi:hypothetical protein